MTVGTLFNHYTTALALVSFVQGYQRDSKLVPQLLQNRTDLAYRFCRIYRILQPITLVI